MFLQNNNYVIILQNYQLISNGIHPVRDRGHGLRKTKFVIWIIIIKLTIIIQGAG